VIRERDDTKLEKNSFIECFRLERHNIVLCFGLISNSSSFIAFKKHREKTFYNFPNKKIISSFNVRKHEMKERVLKRLTKKDKKRRKCKRIYFLEVPNAPLTLFIHLLFTKSHSLGHQYFFQRWKIKVLQTKYWKITCLSTNYSFVNQHL